MDYLGCFAIEMVLAKQNSMGTWFEKAANLRLTQATSSKNRSTTQFEVNDTNPRCASLRSEISRLKGSVRAWLRFLVRHSLPALDREAEVVRSRDRGDSSRV